MKGIMADRGSMSEQLLQIVMSQTTAGRKAGGSPQKQIGGAGGTKRFQDVLSDSEDEHLKGTSFGLVSTDFLSHEKWGPTSRSDLLVGGKVKNLQSASSELMEWLSRGLTLICPFPLPAGSRYPGVWLPFEKFDKHPCRGKSNFVMNALLSPLWKEGTQGWHIITGLITAGQIKLVFMASFGGYEISSTEKAKKVCLEKVIEGAEVEAGNLDCPGVFRGSPASQQ